jgi:hypothetical protein
MRFYSYLFDILAKERFGGNSFEWFFSGLFVLLILCNAAGLFEGI